MVWFIGQSIVVIAAAFLLGILVGWLSWGRTWRPKRVASRSEAGTQAPKPEPQPMAAEAPKPEPQPEMVTMAAEAAEAPKPEPVVLVGAETAAAATAPAEPVAAVATLEAEVPDDLERIEGIGPKLANALNDAGIRTYSQLADADEATLRQAIESHGMRFAPSIVTWGRQARLLADGDEEGFEDLTRRLVAGRDEGRQ